MSTNYTSTNRGAEFAEVAAHLLDGRFVRLTTNRGRTVDGLLTAGHASCVVGFAGRFAYGGVADIREVEEVW